MAGGSSIIVRLVGDSSRLEQSLTRAERRLDTFNRRVQRGMAIAGKGLAFAGIAATTLAIGKSITVFASYEKQMSKVKAVSGATMQEFKALEQVTKQLGRTTQFTATEAAQALTFMSMAGMQAADQIKALPSVLSLAAATSAELGESADIVTNIMSGFNIETADLSKAVDTMVATLTNSNTNIQEMGEAFKYVGPIASGLGVPFQDTAAAIGVLGDNGIKASMAGTALRRALLQLVDPPASAVKGLATLGLTVADLKDGPDQLKPLTEVFAILQERGMGLADSAAIFGPRSAGAIDKLVQASGGKFDELVRTLHSSAGIAEDVQTTMLDNIAGQWTLFKSALEGIALTIGTNLLPAIKPLLDGIIGVTRGVSDFIDVWTTGNKFLLNMDTGELGEEMSRLDHVISRVKDAWENVLVVLRPIGAVLTSAWKGVKVFVETSWLWRAALVAIAAVVATALVPALITLGAVLATNPVVLLAGAFVGLVAIVGKVDEKFGRIPAIITAVVGGVGILTLLLMINAGAWLANATAAWATAAAHLKASVMYAVLAVKASILTVAQWALNAAMYANPFGLVVLAIVALIAAVVLAIKYWDKITAAANWLWDAFKKLPGPIKVFIAIFAWLPLLIIGLVKAINWLRENWQQVWDAVPRTFEDASKAILKLFYFGFGWMLPGGLLAKAYGWLRETLTGLWRRVTAIWKGAKRILGVDLEVDTDGGVSQSGPGAKKGLLERWFDLQKNAWASLGAKLSVGVDAVIKSTTGTVGGWFDAIKDAWNKLGGQSSTTTPLPGGRNATGSGPVLSIGMAAATLNVAGIWAGIKAAWKAINPALNVAIGFPRRAGTAIWNSIKSAFDKAKSLLSVAIGVAGLPADWATKAFAALKVAWLAAISPLTFGIALLSALPDDWATKAFAVIKAAWILAVSPLAIAVALLSPLLPADWATKAFAALKANWVAAANPLALAVALVSPLLPDDWATKAFAALKIAWLAAVSPLAFAVSLVLPSGWATTVWNAVKAAWKALTKDNLPIGIWFVAGAGKRIFDGLKTAFDAAKSTLSISIDWVGDTAATVWAGVKSAWDGLATTLGISVGTSTSGTSTTTGLATSAKQNTANTALSDIKTKLDTGNKSLASISTSAWTSKFELIKIRIAIVDGLIGFAKRTDGWLENILRTLTPKQTTSSTAGFKSIPGVIQGRGAPGANDRIYWYGGPSRTQVSDFSAAGMGYAQFLKKWLGSGGGGGGDTDALLKRVSVQLQNLFGALTEVAIGNWAKDVPAAGTLSEIKAASLKAFTPLMSIRNKLTDVITELLLMNRSMNTIVPAIHSMRDTLKKAIDAIPGSGGSNRNTPVVAPNNNPNPAPQPSANSITSFALNTQVRLVTESQVKALSDLLNAHIGRYGSAGTLTSRQQQSWRIIGWLNSIITDLKNAGKITSDVRSALRKESDGVFKVVRDSLRGYEADLFFGGSTTVGDQEALGAAIKTLFQQFGFASRVSLGAQGVTGVGGPGGPGSMPASGRPERVVYNFNIKMDSGGAGDDFETRFRKMIRKLQREGVLPRPA